MPTRNVVVTERQDELIDALVTSGRYQNASEVLREGLRLIENREAEDAAKLEGLRMAADIGIAAIERGEFKLFSSVSEAADYLRRFGDSILAQPSDEV